MIPERRQQRRLFGIGAQRHGQMLVDVGVEGQNARTVLDREEPAKQGGQGGLSATTLADECSFHTLLVPVSISIVKPKRRTATARMDVPRACRTSAAPSNCGARRDAR